MLYAAAQAALPGHAPRDEAMGADLARAVSRAARLRARRSGLSTTELRSRLPSVRGDGWSRPRAAGGRSRRARPPPGPATAPVTIVEFTGLPVPLLPPRPEHDRRDPVPLPGQGAARPPRLPAEGHPAAMPAARASRCAGEQGKFWDYHRSPSARGRWTTRTSRGGWPGLKLDAGAFSSCLASERFDAAIRASFEEGRGGGGELDTLPTSSTAVSSPAPGPSSQFSGDHRRRSSTRGSVAARSLFRRTSTRCLSIPCPTA